METFQYTITDEIGIHARPAGELAKLAKEFQSKITIKTETKQTINNTKTKKKVSDDQTSGKTGRNEENKAGEGAQTDIAESKVTFLCCLFIHKELRQSV